MFSHSRHLSLVLLLGPLAGCGFDPVGWAGGLFNSQPAGVVTGLVRYGGEPASGKHVSLGDGSAKATTDANGRYTFRGLSGKKVQVLYQGQGDQAGVLPNEVATWRTLTLDLTDGSGKEAPAFDVAYNGLLYPDALVALVVSETSLVPFHWSVHAQAQRYRVHVTSDDKTFTWASPWDAQPTAVFGKTVAPGHYNWQVEIDGGNTGAGTTRLRVVDF
jgi:hypothetical protein